MPLPSRRTLLPLLGAALGLLVILGALVVQRAGLPSQAATGIGGPFALVDGDGRAVTQADVAGQPMLVFFGYTHCPDVCPTTLDAISQTLKALGPDGKVRALFITLDPERDTPAVMKDYVSSFDPRILGLTGSQAAVDKVAREYRVYAKKVPTGDGGYSVDHTGVVYLMDRKGNFVESFNPDLDKPAEAAKTLAAYL
ncbi:SCO family protein [Lichenibacterium ramalinae]|uniref:SCO family protein n=1 Tax=Lichenibacterium ramalinae TaxID=2316527 RepID=A0A4Q2RIM8_9HYPH|nr:SCO family protein [Lichenibacterium ramalinae]RYB07906.1 SCO family protein [Lichenibacterium ramalinae]